MYVHRSRSCDQSCDYCMQTAIDVARQHPEAKREEFIQLFLEYRHKSPRIPKVGQSLLP